MLQWEPCHVAACSDIHHHDVYVSIRATSLSCVAVKAFLCSGCSQIPVERLDSMAESASSCCSLAVRVTPPPASS